MPNIAESLFERQIYERFSRKLDENQSLTTLEQMSFAAQVGLLGLEEIMAGRVEDHGMSSGIYLGERFLGKAKQDFENSISDYCKGSDYIPLLAWHSTAPVYGGQIINIRQDVANARVYRATAAELAGLVYPKYSLVANTYLDAMGKKLQF